MDSGCENTLITPLARRTPRISYTLLDVGHVLDTDGLLAAFTFGGGSAPLRDPRCLRVPLEPLRDHAPREIWQVEGPVNSGTDDTLQWSAGGGWLFAAIEVDEREHAGPEGAAAWAYTRLCAFLRTRPERHVLRLWNYQGAINRGSGDAERYKLFCDGRARGMGSFFVDGFPAASALGHHGPMHQLQVYLLACDQPGTRVENPRQVSAWRYPRQYGRTPPSFARATTMPAGDALAISGTAAVVGHASAHHDDLDAQVREILTNLDALLAGSQMTRGFNPRSPLKAYVRDPDDAERVRALLHQHLPDVPLLMLNADICRSELQVEIDGWRFD
ncbi:MAG: pteridine-dependent deoxygenase [Rhodanobacter sp.]